MEGAGAAQCGAAGHLSLLNHPLLVFGFAVESYHCSDAAGRGVIRSAQCVKVASGLAWKLFS
jgi:hypothetical protein